MSNTQIAIDAVRLLEVLEKENAELQAMLEKCNSKFIVELEAKNAALREEIRELNQMGFTHKTAAAQKAALDASEYICTCGIRVTPHKCLTDNVF